jgi:hypothetical protein
LPSRATIARWSDRALPAWFALWSLVRLQQLGLFQGDWTWFGRDFRIYRDAALALLNGSDPWDAADHWNGQDWHFAALPTAAQAFIPFAILPEGVGLALFLGLSIGVFAFAMRRLRLPLWWLLFPPVAEGLGAANPQILAFGLLIVGGPALAGPVGRAIATALKVFAIVPVVARREWRGLLAFGIVLAVSLVLAPSVWATYIARFGEIGARVAHESSGGVSAALVLDPKVFGTLLGTSETVARLAGLGLFALIVALVVLVAVRDVRSAGWLVVSLLWPAAEYHAAAFAIPIARRLAIWIIAVPTIPTYLLGLIVLAYQAAAGAPALPEEPPPVGLRAWLASLRPPRRSTAPIEPTTEPTESAPGTLPPTESPVRPAGTPPPPGS